MIQLLQSWNLTPDKFYVASMGSILLSLILWLVPRSGDDATSSRPERLAIFVGLWAPTLFLMGHVVDQEASAEVQRSEHVSAAMASA